jgi:hypothetical protein
MVRFPEPPRRDAQGDARHLAPVLRRGDRRQATAWSGVRGRSRAGSRVRKSVTFFGPASMTLGPAPAEGSTSPARPPLSEPPHHVAARIAQGGSRVKSTPPPTFTTTMQGGLAAAARRTVFTGVRGSARGRSLGRPPRARSPSSAGVILSLRGALLRRRGPPRRRVPPPHHPPRRPPGLLAPPPRRHERRPPAPCARARGPGGQGGLQWGDLSRASHPLQ